MSLQATLHKTTSFLDARIHPFIHADEGFRKLYCFGIGLLCLGHMNAIEELEDTYLALLSRMELPLSFRDTVIIEINHNVEYRIDQLFHILDTKDKQYCFIIDLYLAIKHAKISESYGRQIIEGFLQVFHFSNKETDFFSFFMECAFTNRRGEAIASYQLFKTEGHVISYRILSYGFPALDMKVSYQGLSLVHGEHFTIDQDCLIEGDVLISNGSSLTLSDADVKLLGKIVINNGSFKALRSTLTVDECPGEYVISATQLSGMELEQLQVYGNSSCGFLTMDKGHLTVQDCYFADWEKESVISFSGQSLTICQSTFQNCGHHAIRILGCSLAFIEDCSFHNCYADHGGAIYSDSLRDVSLSGNYFKNCEARYLGACVYFKQKKYGQRVTGSVLEQCLPADALIFNAFPEPQ